MAWDHPQMRTGLPETLKRWVTCYVDGAYRRTNHRMRGKPKVKSNKSQFLIY